VSAILAAGLAALLLSALTTLALVPGAIRVAVDLDAVDQPGGRRLGERPTPRIGGAALAGGIAAGAAVPALVLWLGWGASVTPFEIWGLALGTSLIFLSGLTEDLVGLSPALRLLIQTAAALGVIAAGWSFDVLYLPFLGVTELGLQGPLLTLIWIVGVTNAINFLDGLDGLASGVTAIIATSLLIFASIQGKALTVVLLAAIVGACLGFLRHNWTPARIYMGDSGALTLGFLLAVMSLHGSIKNAATVAILVPILTLGLPVIDALLVMTVRLAEHPRGPISGRLARVFRADSNHLHHLMMEGAPERRAVVVALYLVAAAFCAMALVVGLSRSGPLGAALVLVEIAVVLLMRKWRHRIAAPRRTRGLAPEEEASTAGDLGRLTARETQAL
jgi:UDP-N-acetylmuramyl pentapeptide phosphotransferase/UDP-N-acetylglucosamine-1-phosphate transferase